MKSTLSKPMTEISSGIIQALCACGIHNACRHLIIGTYHTGKGNSKLQKVIHGLSATGFLEIPLKDQVLVNLNAKLCQRPLVAGQAFE